MVGDLVLKKPRPRLLCPLLQDDALIGCAAERVGKTAG